MTPNPIFEALFLCFGLFVSYLLGVAENLFSIARSRNLCSRPTQSHSKSDQLHCIKLLGWLLGYFKIIKDKRLQSEKSHEMGICSCIASDEKWRETCREELWLVRQNYLPPPRHPSFGQSRKGYGRYDFPSFSRIWVSTVDLRPQSLILLPGGGGR